MGARYYDAAGNLVGITDGTGTTVTLGSITAHHNKATGAKTATKTYTFAGKVVGQRTTAGAGTTKLAFIIGDSVNTAQTMTLPNTTASTTNITTLVRRTDPLGLARGSNGTASGNASFTAAANTTAGTGSNAANATGFGAVNGYIAGLNDTASSLTHLGARELDPVIGIFTSPDPILSTEDHRGFTPYTYAFGNVINTSDPTGLRPTCDCEADGSSGTVPGSAQQLQNDYVRNTAPPQLHLTSSKNLGAPGNGMPSRNSYLRYTEPDRCTVGSYSSCSQSQYFLKAARNYHEFENTDWAAALMGFLDFVMIAVTFAEVTGTLGFGTPVVAAQDAAYIGWRSSKLGPSNAANGPRLAQQLAREQAASRANALFTRSGNLTTEAVRDAKIIIPGEELGLRDPNQTLIKYLTRDGSDIKDWGKYSTKSMTESPYGDFKVHFYKNEATGAVDYGYDYKAVFRSR
ncbi:RHS repeat-associated core domain-containing protein [Paenarthrobacter ureafaciens]